MTAIAHGLSTHEAEAIRINGSEYAANVDKLMVENELLRAANGENLQKEEDKRAENEKSGDFEAV